MEKNLLNKETYKAVKRMNREEMKERFEEIYKLGFRDGAESGNSADFKIKLVQVLNKTKGIGPKTIDKVLQTLKEEE